MSLHEISTNYEILCTVMCYGRGKHQGIMQILKADEIRLYFIET